MGSAILMTFITFIVTYTVSFKDDFKKEDIDKVMPCIARRWSKHW